MARELDSTPEQRAAQRVKDYTDVMWHAASYVILNVFLWVIVPHAAFWITLGWGIALAFHVAYYFIGDDGPENRRYQAFLGPGTSPRKAESKLTDVDSKTRTRYQQGSSTILQLRQSQTPEACDQAGPLSVR